MDWFCWFELVGSGWLGRVGGVVFLWLFVWGICCICWWLVVVGCWLGIVWWLLVSVCGFFVGWRFWWVGLLGLLIGWVGWGSWWFLVVWWKIWWCFLGWSFIVVSSVICCGWWCGWCGYRWYWFGGNWFRWIVFLWSDCFLVVCKGYWLFVGWVGGSCWCCVGLVFCWGGWLVGRRCLLRCVLVSFCWFGCGGVCWLFWCCWFRCWVFVGLVLGDFVGWYRWWLLWCCVIVWVWCLLFVFCWSCGWSGLCLFGGWWFVVGWGLLCCGWCCCCWYRVFCNCC